MEYYPLNIEKPFGVKMVELTAFPEEIFDTPFTFQGVKKFKNSEENHKRKILEIGAYIEMIKKSDYVKPTGFIYHPTRCGSTLVSQMFAQLDDTRVVSEPKIFLDYFSYFSEDGQREINIEELKYYLLGYARRDKRPIKHVFFKIATLFEDFLPYIKAAFPDVPWLYIYRNPVEIAVSHLSEISPKSIVFFGQKQPLLAYRSDKTLSEIKTLSENDFIALLITSDYKAFIKHMTTYQDGYLVNYLDVKDIFIDKVLAHFGIVARDGEINKIQYRSGFYSKQEILQPFKNDIKEKLELASEEIRAAIKEYNVIEQYEKLNQLTVY